MTNYRILRVVLLLLLGSLLVTRSVALEIVGSVGGYCPSVAARDGYVYLCEGRGLTVLDARAAGDPMVIERVRLDAGTTCVRLDNDVAYVGTVDKKVRIYSLANPTSPSLLSTITLIGGSLTDAAFEGNHAFFANEGGVEIVNVSDKATPVGVSRYELPDDSYYGPRRLCVSGSQMFLTRERIAVHVVDVSNRMNPRFAGSLPSLQMANGSFSNGVEEIEISGSYLYVLWSRVDHIRYPVHRAAVGVYRLDNTGIPRLMASSDAPSLASCLLLSESTGRACVLDGYNCELFDISAPPALEKLSSLLYPRRPLEGTLDGNSLFITDYSRLTTVRIGQDDAMSFGGQYARISSPGVSSLPAGDYFAATGNALALVSITSPTAPSRSYTLENNSPIVSVAANGRFLYLSNELEGLDVRYITPEPTFARVATLDPLAWENLEGPRYGRLVLAGQRVWLAYTAGKSGARTIGLIGFDNSNPLHPATRSTASRSSSFDQGLGPAGVAVSGTRACVAADKLYFFDIADPSSPRFLSEVAVGISYEGSRVFWSGDSVIIIDRSYGLRVVNASDPSNPVLLASSSSLPNESNLMWVENSRAYIANYWSLEIYHVVPGGEPVLLESFSSRGEIGSVEVYGGHVYALDPLDGLLVMKTNFPDHLAQRHLLGSDTGAADQNGDGVIDTADLVLAMAAARE